MKLWTHAQAVGTAAGIGVLLGAWAFASQLGGNVAWFFFSPVALLLGPSQENPWIVWPTYVIYFGAAGFFTATTLTIKNHRYRWFAFSACLLILLLLHSYAYRNIEFLSWGVK